MLSEKTHQTSLFQYGQWGEASAENLPSLFKRVYYHLYTNSKASRAEAIVEDLTLLLLCKLTAELNGGADTIKRFQAGKGTANKLLLPIIRGSYPELLSSKQSFSLGDPAIRSALDELSVLKLAAAPAHALGEAFQALIGPRLRGERGQFFTPRSLVKAMVEIVDPKPDERVLDPACGTGGFLSETLIYQTRKYPKDKATGQLVGVDKDSGLARLAAAMLRVVAGNRSSIRDFNSLDLLEWQSHAGEDFEGKFDVVLTNPPFGSKIGVDSEEILARYDFGRVWVPNESDKRWVKTDGRVADQDPQVLFLELGVRALKPGGRMAIVLPEGMFGNKGTMYIWNWLKEHGEVRALLDCPRTTFQPGTDTKTNVLVFQRAGGRTKATRGGRQTRVAVALKCGHDRRGRTQVNGEPYEDDFPIISAAFHAKNTDIWRTVNIEDSQYVVPRYHFVKAGGAGEETEFGGQAVVTALGDLVDTGLMAIKKGHEVGAEAYGTGDIPFVRTSDLSNFEISSDPTKSVSEEIYEEYAPQQNLQPGDVLMVVDGRYRIGTTALLSGNNYKCVAQSHLRVISISDHSQLDPYELLFALNLPSVKLQLRSLVFIQSTLGTLGSRLLELKIPLLSGQGPWRERIDRFREALRRRDQLLRDVQAMSGPEVEL